LIESAAWFAGLIVTSLMAVVVASYIARRRPAARHFISLCVFALTLLALWLSHRPDLTVQFISPDVLIYLESTATLPLTALLIGLGWRTSRIRRARMLMVTGGVIVAGCFIYNSFWMIWPNAGTNLSDKTAAAPIKQSTPYSCVPAACASALGQMGIVSCESEMAELTQTVPLRGATILRAYAGLSKRLSSTDMSLHLTRPSWRDLQSLPMPALAVLQFRPDQTHMVLILSASEHQLQMFDPIDGELLFPRDAYERHATGQVIWFDGPRPNTTWRANAKSKKLPQPAI